MLRIGIIGTGRLGSFHADKAAAHPQVELVGVADPNEEARNALVKKYNVSSYASFEDLLPSVDAVVIASPTMLHYEIGSACLHSGKHVLMEKPMCASLAEGRKLVELAKKKGLVLQVGHVEEFNPAWGAAKKNLRNELISGEPILIDAVRTSGYTFRSTDIGTVFDMMIHDIDLVLSFTGSHVYSVDATGFHVVGGQHEDIAHARLLFDSGCIAHLFSSRVAENPERKMKITTSAVAMTVDFGTRTTACYRADDMVLQGNYSPHNIQTDMAVLLSPTFMKERFTSEIHTLDAVDALAAELDDFVVSIETSKTPRVSGTRALEAISVAETIVRLIAARRGTQQNVRYAA